MTWRIQDVDRHGNERKMDAREDIGSGEISKSCSDLERRQAWLEEGRKGQDTK
jgi:hypothetical protein